MDTYSVIGCLDLRVEARLRLHLHRFLRGLPTTCRGE
jgi:hypothetical protein